ncbi:lipopolysaccharide-responsive and beige-like anchor protein isoform X2 [Hippocampus zosterae]|uniref:lipopolysaccharide-responsive and beige-like anchor protein isoform X2 n=1 Tax=Hippocampus zosterae TaxID=109293 RepID=UPI00223CBB9C|nr:lipopolysaccharide-responsive and beige-like anchor protein isoform X2 [Hippocampus zosterae]
MASEETAPGTLPLNPAVPIRGIRMKFAVLDGLREVGEVSNRDVVETVFNLLVGGQFDLEMNFIIQEPESIVCMVELLDKCEPTCQAEVLSIFTAILKKSVRNLQACTDVGLIQLVLRRISDTDSMIADLLVDMLGVLASYSITVKELKLFFSKLQGEKGQWPRHAVKLLSVLKYMAHRNGPDSFFSFPGKNAAAIALPPIAKWPYQNGFTFHTWLRMDPLNNLNVDKDKPYLYCFRTSKGLGYSAHFVGGCLIVTSLKTKGKGFQHCVKYDFKPQKWYMVTLVHVYNRWKNSEISCYVNGELASFGEIAWFVNTSDTFDKCFLGSSETADANRVFCGQMGAVYLFGEALNAAQILAIYQLGPGYQGTFKYKAESDLLFAEHHKMLLYDGKLSAAIAFAYNARATDAQLCLESSPKDNASIFVHSPHALMLQDVKAVVTHSVQSGIHSIGGVQVLFPLFAQLDFCQPSSHELDTSVCCTLLSFVMELLKNSVAMQEQVLACKGFLVIGYTLEKSSKVHVTRPVLDIVLAFSRYLSNLQNGILLLKQLCDHILFNPAIWIHAAAKVQLTLYTYLATEFISTVTIYNAIRRVGTVLQVMHTLKYYYWVVNPHDRSGVVPKGVDGPRPKEMLSLRAFLLLFVKQLIMKDTGVKEDELQSILNYLLTMHEDDNLMDVLQLLVALMSEHPGSMVQAFDQRNGIRVIYKLLASKSEGIRVQTLKVLGYFLKHLPPKRKSEVMLSHGLFSLLTERLMLHSAQFSMTTYNVLFEILTEQICTQVIHKQHPEPDSSVKIINPQILKVIANLLKNSPLSPETMEVRKVFLSDMIKLFNNSRDNRRSLLQCSVWQEWMLSLCFISPCNSEEQKVTEMVYAVFRILLYHAVKYEWGGWRVWVDTLSITHAKVTFEQHKEHLSRMFRQYQRQESTGSLGTIRTVSGVSESSETAECTNGPPSTVIELTVDEPSAKESDPLDVSVTMSKVVEEEQRLYQEASKEDVAIPTNHLEEQCGTTDQQETIEKPDHLPEAPRSEDPVAVEREVIQDGDPTNEDEPKNDQVSPDPAAPLDILLEGASVFNENLAEVSSVSDHIDDSQGELSYASAATEEDSVGKNEGHDMKREVGELQEIALEENNEETRAEVVPQGGETHPAPKTTVADEDVTDPPEEEPASTDQPPTAPSTGQEDLKGSDPISQSQDITVSGEESPSSVAVRSTAIQKTKEIKIARLDVANVALDTERLELRQTHSTETSQTTTTAAGGPSSAQPRESGTSVPRSTMFRIPEFRWSHMHQRLLTDLLFAIETDVQAWRSHSTKTVLDFVNSSDNVVFVHNSVHLISQVVDNLVMACGGILPLLSAATSSSHELEDIEPSQGLTLDASVAFLQRLVNLMDILVFASSLNFAEIEAEKNMSSGGILRQCLRLVCAMAVRNCLECQQAQLKLSKEANSPISGKSVSAQSPVDAVTGGMSPVRDFERLLQDMDINRLRAVVFRDIDSKQAQFLALAVVYFISVLMVSKYRDILEPHNDNKHSQRSQLSLSTDSGAAAALPESDNGVALRRYDSGIGDEHASIAAASEAEASSTGGAAHGPDAVSEALSTLSSEVRPSEAKGKNVKDILRSLVSAPADDIMVDPGLLPPAFLGSGVGVGDVSRDSLQIRSFDRSVVLAPKKAGVTSQVPAAAAANPAAAPPSMPPVTPIDGVAVVSTGDASQTSSNAEAGGQVPASASLPSVPALSPVTQHTAPNMSISERLEHALEKAAPLLREIFVDFAPFLSRTLLGSHGQELLIEGTSLVCIKSSSSVVELVMLLCSQEWQNSIQKNAGLAFIELVNEGRLLSHTMKDHLVRVANEAEFILSRQRAEDIHKHADFESNCAQYSAEKRDEEKMCDHLIRAAKYRDHVTATQLIQKIVNILTDKHGAWGASSGSRPREFWRLDYWEDDLRRRRRFVRNPFGSTHSEATLKAAADHVAGISVTEDDVLKGKQSIKTQAVVHQNSESDASLDADDDTLSSLEEKELENFTGPVNVSTTAQLVAPAAVVRGTLSITASELYFEVDEDEPAFKAIEPKILAYTEGLHGKWLFTEIRAIFSRRYLLQNTALEIFMANRTAVMFNFPDAATVKKVVHSLPRVGLGTNFGLPQTRRISLATPKQLFKASNMSQRWQRREISNFEYLIFLNTISGRTYNDLNQYPVFPWIITNYEAEQLDLTLPSNFRDLSKPIGALNPKRAAFFSDRYESWDDDQVPKFHYGTHYSTSSFTLMWLLRMEPFTTFFLNLQGGKFDHTDRTFSSVSRAWRNCQRDTSDVKELIPEFYYLPEMFVNANTYNLGVMEDGTAVSDVELPPWAKTPEEFVRINRQALESEFVSCQLHQWIDLIFGYKQQGPEATRALNVFYYLTYEGAVNLSSIGDPMLREAVESQIQSFGQTPCQLLIEPHTPRSSAMQMYLLLQTPLMFTEQMQQDVIMVLKFPSNSPVSHVAANTQPGLTAPAVITVTASRVFAVNKWHGLTGHPSSGVQQQDYQLPVEIDPLVASNMGSHRRQISDLLDQSIQISSQCFIVTADNRFILLCGFWDKSFRIYSTDTGKLTQIVFGHRDVVTCLARSESYIGGDCYVVSGSRDATLLLWYWNGKLSSIGESAATGITTPRAILTGHDCEVTCSCVCAELGLVLSGCKEGPCLIHSMNGDLLRTLEGPEGCSRPRLIQASAEGHCVIYYDKGQFGVFSVNGKLLGHMRVEDAIKAMLLSRDGQYLLTGGDGGVISVLRVHDLKPLFAYPGCDAGIRSMAMSHDQRCIITGMASGSIVLFYNDFNRWHHEYQTRY